MFYVFIKDSVAVAKVKSRAIENIDTDLYDSYSEITESEFNEIELPATLRNGIWVKVDNAPIIDYPTTTPEPTELERIRADIDFIAVMTGIEL